MRVMTIFLDTLLPVLGVLIILAGLMPEISGREVGIIVFGVLFIQAGMLRVSRKLLSEERQFLALRAEGDLFFALLRQLNAAGVALKREDSPDRHREFNEIQQAMRESLERMTTHAGRTVEHIAEEAGRPDAVSMWKAEFGSDPDEPLEGSDKRAK